MVRVFVIAQSAATAEHIQQILAVSNDLEIAHISLNSCDVVTIMRSRLLITGQLPLGQVCDGDPRT